MKSRQANSTTSDARKAAVQLLDELTKRAPKRCYSFRDIEKLNATKELLTAAPEIQKAAVCVGIERISALRKKLGKPKPMDSRYMNLHHEDGFPLAVLQVVMRLFRRKLPFTDDELVYLVRRTADLELTSIWTLPYLSLLVGIAEKQIASQGLSKPMDAELGRLAKSLEWVDNAAERKLRKAIEGLKSGPNPLPIEAGEAWADAVIADLASMRAKQRSAWHDLLYHCSRATSAQPSSKWRDDAHRLVGAVKEQDFKARVLKWFPLVDKPRTKSIEQWSEWQPDPNRMIDDANADVLKGLVWCCPRVGDSAVARALAGLCTSAYKKVPRIGPRSVKLGNACVNALGDMPGTDGLAQLALLKVKVKFGTAQKGIEKALTAVAERLGLPRDEIEELAVPTYGMDEVGERREPWGDFIAELLVAPDGSTKLHWLKADGKQQKSVPAAVANEFADDLKELKAAAKDIQKMLPAQRERIDNLFLAQKQWPQAVWRERYLDHPLVGVVARRIIWQFVAGDERRSGCWLDGRLVDHQDRPLELAEGTVVELWHPIGRSTDEIVAWRQWLERHEIRQPFKQAHREVYLLTDAERRTDTYSNRFAAHVIRQHQFNALCGQRGWKNKLRLLVDDAYPAPSRALPLWGLRAEFWVEGAGTEYGVDTNDAGSFLHLATDQVRFYPIAAEALLAHAGGGGYGRGRGEGTPLEPMSLDQVPPLVFSEIMRDVDLFVGVASVGNDPTWADGGPQGRYVDYWQRYSFGDLSATAETRKAVLERIVPRLRIADRCSFADRFLKVRGDLRTYKIHLGSGNILMEPNDQYLCIVPNRSAAAKDGNVFLPFEGDGTLSIVLSKALLLADDKKIMDPTIMRQIVPS